MLNTLRKLNEEQASKRALTEGYDLPDDMPANDNPQGGSDQTPESVASDNVKDNITVINDVDVKLQSGDQADMQLSDEQKTAISGIIDTFRQQVSQIASLDPGFSISPNQIRFDGQLTDFDLRFTFVAGQDTGLYLISDMMLVNPDVLAIITKMGQFDKMYRDAMEPLLTQRQNN
jgi:hypothetical protein